MSKVAVLGLDGLNPELVRKWVNELPNLRDMQQTGTWGKIECTSPATTPQAWTCAQCGRNPGVYGFWDSTYRDDFSYGEPRVVNSEIVDERVDCLYKILPKMGQKVATINTPLSWPPLKIPGGYCITGSMPPSLNHGFAYPKNLQDEVQKVVGDYIISIIQPGVNYHQIDRNEILKRVYDMDAQRFMLMNYFIHEKKGDYVFALVTGNNYVSRLFHHYSDEKHRWYDSTPINSMVLREYYIWLDKNVGQVRQTLDNDTTLFIQSSYGAHRLDGQINLNEWLVSEGYMTLREYPTKPMRLSELEVDWSKTKAWSMGCTSRIYLNLKGRETQGIVEPNEYDKLLNELADKIRNIPGENGEAFHTKVFYRDDIYSGPYAEYGPDLLVSFADNHWNTNEMVGYGRGEIYLADPVEEADDTTNSLYGYFCIAGPGIPAKGEMKEVTLLSIAPTVLDVMGLKIPEDMEGTSILARIKGEEGKHKPSTETKDILHSRFRLLGY